MDMRTTTYPVLAQPSLRLRSRLAAALTVCASLLAVPACHKTAQPEYRTFATPEDGVRALISAASNEKVDEIVAIFGPEGAALIDTTDPASARRGRQVFTAAAAEGWHLTDRDGGGKTLVVGNEK